jgi:DNA-binding NarL/FixJ family response regulator
MGLTEIFEFSNIETKIIRYLLENKTYQEIAVELHMPIEDVKEHLDEIYKKLDIFPLTSSALSKRLWSAATSFCPQELSPREWDVAKLIAQGNTTIEIAYELGLAEGTVIEYRRRLYDKLEVKAGARDKGAVSTWVMEQLITHLFNQELARHLLKCLTQGLLSTTSQSIKIICPLNVPCVIHGNESIFEQVFGLLSTAAQNGPNGNSKILLTFRGEDTSFTKDQWPKWQEALTSALVKGWDIVHLLKLSEAEWKVLRLITNFLSVLGFPRRYEPFYFKDMIIDSHDFIIIPGYGGMLLITNQETGTVDTAFFCPDKDYTDALRDDFRFLYKGTKPLFTTYSIKN